MAEATHRLPLPASDGDPSEMQAITFATCPFTLITQARLAAFKIIKQKLIAQGIKTSFIQRSTITAAAIEYLQHHPELIEEAAESVRNHPKLRTLAEREARERMRKQRCPV